MLGEHRAGTPRFTEAEVHIRRAIRTLRARAAAAGTSLSEYLLRDITRLAERPPVADVISHAGSRSGGADIDLIVEAVRSGRDRL